MFYKICKAIIPMMLISFLVSAQSEKKTYTIKTTDLKDSTLHISIQDDKPFHIDFLETDSLGFKSAVIFINDWEAQTFTSLSSLKAKDFIFKSSEIKTIRLKLQVATKSYLKPDTSKMVILTYNGKVETLSPKDLNNFLEKHKIDNYCVANQNIIQDKKFNLTDPKEYTLVFTNDGDTTRNGNFFMASLIKSLAGARPQDELIDLFFKLNYGKQKRFFTLLGADAGIGSNKDSGSSTGIFRINEAVANLNYAIYDGRKVNKLYRIKRADSNIKRADATKLNDSLKKENVRRFDALNRTAFLGGGLKIFGSIPYVGVHFGSIEINGPLYGSYILTGFYYRPYTPQNFISKDSITYRSYRKNIYLEAGLNAFGSKVPTILKTVKLKFGLMFPIYTKKEKADKIDRPSDRDVISRLSIEVPLGSLFRF